MRVSFLCIYFYHRQLVKLHLVLFNVHYIVLNDAPQPSKSCSEFFIPYNRGACLDVAVALRRRVSSVGQALAQPMW